MVILGISGFEDFRKASAVASVRYRHDSIKNLLSFGEKYLPLQYFPLHLIGHDCSAALIVDGRLVAFAAEERFSRIKHGLNLAGNTVLPRSAINFCLKQAGMTWNDIDYIAHFCDFDESAIQERIAYLSNKLEAGYRQVLVEQYHDVYDNCLNQETLLKQLTQISGSAIDKNNLIPVRHHLAHAAGAFYSSGFKEALIMTIDGYGEKESALIACGNDKQIEIIDQVRLPTSLGLLYQVITVYLGFRSYGDEYKVMGLSSYGDRNEYQSAFNDFVELKNGGNYTITGITSPDLYLMLKDYFGEIDWRNGISQKAADIAAALQDILEKTLLHSLSYYREKYKLKTLCLSGGVALNATANGVINRSGLFERVFIQPAAADDGASLGAALYANNQLSPEANKPIKHTYWGPDYDRGQVENVLQGNPDIRWRRKDNIIRTTAELLADGKLIGWFQGRMEMGPRALGARSILSDPRKKAYRDRLNLKIKNRESFRPFAPSVLEEEAGSFFILNGSRSDPYMITTVPVKRDKQKLIPAVIHVDGTSRLQTVSETINPRYYRLLKEFYEITGIPMVLNTSFNQAGEPIVCSPEDALNCFLRCGLDALVIEDFLIYPTKLTEEKYESEEIHIA
jgi:carbamoyltransferase